MKKKKAYVIQVIAVLVLMLAFQWYFNRMPWESVTFYSTDKAEEYIVFSEKLRAGHKMLIRLDLQEGAEDKGSLVLELPNKEKLQWAQGYKQTKKQLELVIPQDGLYKLSLNITPSDISKEKPPYIRVNWQFR